MPEDSKGTTLVVGGAGYIGSVLVRRLLSAGASVRAFDSLLYANGASLSALAEEERFSFVRGDIRDDAAVAAALDGVTDVVVLAALVGDPVCKANPELARETNLSGVRNVINAAAESGAERFVFASTCSNYGLRPDEQPATEEDDLHPLSLYAENKVEMEREILGRADELPFCPTVLRVSTAFGLSPRMRFDLTISEFTRGLALGKELEVYDPDTWRPYCHVEDISAAITTVLAAEEDAVRAEVFNVGGEDSNHTKRMVVEAALEALDGEGSVIWTEGGTDARNYRVSFDKIRKRLGYEPEHTVAGSIANLIGAIRDGLFDRVDENSLYHRNYELEPAVGAPAHPGEEG